MNVLFRNISTSSFRGAHYATFPEKLIEIPIKAGCPIDGIVLDPFMGSGTTALICKKLNRNYIGFDINEDYVKIAEDRIGEIDKQGILANKTSPP